MIKTRYKEKHRPQFHYSPEEKWMNDPNGMVFFEGEYHLFYQYHPFGQIQAHGLIVTIEHNDA